MREAPERAAPGRRPSKRRRTSAIKAAELPIARLEIEGFRSIREASLELAAVNCFVGGNGAGKTNLLEAFGVLGAAVTGPIDGEILRARGVRAGKAETFKSAFRDEPHRMPSLIRLDAVAGDGTALHLRLTSPVQVQRTHWVFQHEQIRAPDGSVVASRGPYACVALGKSAQPSKHQSVASTLQEVPAVAEPVRRFLAHLGAIRVFRLQTPVLAGEWPEPAPAVPIGLHGGELALAVMWMMNSNRPEAVAARTRATFLVDWLQDLAVDWPPTLRLRDRHLVASRGWLSARDAPDSALHALAMLVLAVDSRTPPVFAIDDVDKCFDARLAGAMVRNIADLAAASGRQVLLTARDASVLDDLPVRQNIRAFAVIRDTGGRTLIERIR